eukprot:6461675-Amphidinium_carterae.1
MVPNQSPRDLSAQRARRIRFHSSDVHNERSVSLDIVRNIFFVRGVHSDKLAVRVVLAMGCMRGGAQGNVARQICSRAGIVVALYKTIFQPTKIVEGSANLDNVDVVLATDAAGHFKGELGTLGREVCNDRVCHAKHE